MNDELAAQVLRRDSRTLHAKTSSQTGRAALVGSKAVTFSLVSNAQLESEQNFCPELYIKAPQGWEAHL